MGTGTYAPAFDAHERALIVSWSKTIRARDFRIEITSSYEFLKEALIVVPTGAAEPLWMVHRTSTGAVAVRQWPGLASIVPTLAEALAIITRDADP